jgi:hypothetical protein
MKIFCIGYNKTGTSSLHHIFLSHGLRASHDGIWTKWSITQDKQNLDNHDTYCDGLGYCDLQYLHNTYPEAQYILNTRNMDDWIISSYNHNLRHNSMNKHKQRPLTQQWITQRMTDRNIWHRIVLNYFQDKNNLTIINLAKEAHTDLLTLVHKLQKILRRKVQSIPRKNKGNTDKTQARTALTQTYQHLNIPQKEWKEDLILKSLPTKPPKGFIEEKRKTIQSWRTGTT